jgi:hypothetical protein
VIGKKVIGKKENIPNPQRAFALRAPITQSPDH